LEGEKRREGERTTQRRSARQGERSTVRVEEDKDGTRRKTGRTAVGYLRIFRFSFLSFFKGKSQIFWITIFSDVYWVDTLYDYTFYSPNYEMEKSED
jgi:hypothetical protein